MQKCNGLTNSVIPRDVLCRICLVGFNFTLMKYIFNHFYILRHDVSRSVICSRGINRSNVDVSHDWWAFVHPIYAMVLSFFYEAIDLDEAEKKISEFFEFSLEYTQKLVCSFIENPNEFHTEYAGEYNNFPKNVIIKESDAGNKTCHYDITQFCYKNLDFKSVRFNVAPLYLTFMVSNKCITSCTYCYADRNANYKPLSFERVEQLIEESYTLGIKSIDIDGGDFFIYPHWQRLLKKLESRDYKPDVISTKYPVNESDIACFSEYAINLQISFDSLNQPILEKIVGRIPDYSRRMQESIKMIDKYTDFQIATVLTTFNCSVDNLEQMYQFLLTLKRLKQWDIRVGFKSLYSRNNFEDIMASKSQIEAVEQWIGQKKTKENAPFKIRWNPGQEVNFFKAQNGSQEFIGGRCSANTFHMFVLPDGKATICEQLYWRPNFLIGDLTQQSISDVWNSPRALYLASRPQTDYSKGSACRTCSIFDKCKSYQNDCFANILKVYGDDNWDHPDPRCAKAPREINSNIYV